MGKLDGAMFRRLLLDDRPVREVGPALASARNGTSVRAAKLGHAPVNSSSRTSVRGPLTRSVSECAVGTTRTATSTVKPARARERAAGASPKGELLSTKCSDCNVKFSPECSVFGSDSEPGRYLCRTCVSGRSMAVGHRAECSKCQRIVSSSRVSEIHRSESGRTAFLCKDCLVPGPHRCAACNGRVSSPVARLGENAYHIGCLKCSLCSARIRGEASHTPPFGLICAKCGEGVTGQSEQLEKVIFDSDLPEGGHNGHSVGITTAVVATTATPSRSLTASETPSGTPFPAVATDALDVDGPFQIGDAEQETPVPALVATTGSRAASKGAAAPCSEEMGALEWDPTSALPIVTGKTSGATDDESKAWYHLSEGGHCALRSTRASRGIPESAPILRSLAPLLPGGVCSMRLRVTCAGADTGTSATAVDLDVGLAASTVLFDKHSSSWRRRQCCDGEMAAEGWLLLCSGPAAARSAAIAEAGGMLERPPGDSVSSKASRRVSQLPNRAASWHCELRNGDLLTIALEKTHRKEAVGNAPIGTVNFLLNNTQILQADLPSHLTGPDDAEEQAVESSEGRRPAYHVVAAVRQPGVGLRLGCDDDLKLCL